MSQYDRYNHIDSIQCVYWVISVLPRGVAALWGIYFPFVMKFFAIYGYMSGFYWLFSYFSASKQFLYTEKSNVFLCSVGLFCRNIAGDILCINQLNYIRYILLK